MAIGIDCLRSVEAKFGCNSKRFLGASGSLLGIEAGGFKEVSQGEWEGVEDIVPMDKEGEGKCHCSL